MKARRKPGEYRQVESELRQSGCPLCGRVADPDSESTREDSRWPGMFIHETCLDAIAWTNMPGRSPREKDDGDSGDGFARWGE